MISQNFYEQKTNLKLKTFYLTISILKFLLEIQFDFHIAQTDIELFPSFLKNRGALHDILQFILYSR